MIPTPGQERRADTKSQLIELLHDPLKLRFIVAATVLGIGYAAIYMPLDRSTTAATRKLTESETKLSLAGEVEQLRKQYQQVEKRLPKHVDADEWVQYVLGRHSAISAETEFVQSGRYQGSGPLSNGILVDQAVGNAERSRPVPCLVGIERPAIST